MDINTYYLTQNESYIEGKVMTPIGIVVHSTGANNPYLKRYIQPDDGRVGKGGSKHWNKKGVYKSAHAMIGKDNDEKVCTYLILPTNICSWSVGQGKKGSYNYPPTACLHFEICEDALTDQAYFDAVMKEAEELCAKWCKEFSLPVSSIRSHKEAHAEGYASNHSDINHWLKRYGKTMDDFRAEVEKLLDEKDFNASDDDKAEANNVSNEYIKTSSEAQNFFIRLLNHIIDFIVNTFKNNNTKEK